MKKQLYRVKQLADQRVGRAEKTDLLTEDLQHVEKTVDKVKVACSSTHKKLSACMLSIDAEKKKKRLNQLVLGQGMLECSAILGETSLLGNVLQSSGEAQAAIANELAIYENEIEDNVMAPLQKLMDVSIPNINLTKKKLSKARLDMDSSKSRWLNAVKVSQGGSGNKLDVAAKAELLKAELEDQTALFQQLQDQIATEMFTFVAGERSYAQWFSSLLEAQMRYHQASLDILRKQLPIMEQQIDDSLFRPVYGCPLDDHLRTSDREIAFVIEECILYLLETGMDIEGLFRLAGSSTKIKKLKSAFDAAIVDIEDFANEIHAVSGALKLYLRELPEPLLTFHLYEDWINASRLKSREQRLQAYWSLVERLPASNKSNLRYLVCFLAKLAENADVNKMSASNIAIVIAPNLLWSSENGGVSIANTGNISIILESLIEHCNYFFPGGSDFSRRHISEEKLETMSMRFSLKEGDSLSSPEVPSSIMGGGSLFSEVSKKLGWKEGSVSEFSTGTSSAIQGYYNPLAAQYDPDLDNHEDDHTPASPPPPSGQTKQPAQPSTDHTALPYSNHKTLNSISSSDDSSSTHPEHKRQNSGGAPRRPAPPIPKHPAKGKLNDKAPGSPKKPPELPPRENESKPKLTALAAQHKHGSEKPD